MAPTHSRLRAVLPVPAELVLEIASYLPLRDHRAMLTASWAFHDIVAPIVYRSVDISIHPSTVIRPCALEHRPFRFLSSLSSTTQHAGTPQYTRCYAFYIVTFAFTSCNLAANLRALPLFAEVLRFTNQLRHLRIDVDKPSQALLLDVFTRKGIIRTPTSSMTSASLCTCPLTYNILPSLESVRSCRLEIVEAIMRFRALRTSVLDSVPSLESCDAFVALNSPIKSSHLTRLSFWVMADDVFESMVGALAVSFPALEHLALRVSPWMTADVFAYVMDRCRETQIFFERLTELSVNLGRIAITDQDLLEEAEGHVRIVGGRRDRLRTIVCGTAMWHREDEYSSWTFDINLPSNGWRWLRDRDRGMWGR